MTEAEYIQELKRQIEIVQAKLDARAVAAPVPDPEPVEIPPIEVEQDAPLVWEIVQGLLDGLRPAPNMTVSEWADEFRMLGSQETPDAGRWKTSRFPYGKEVMDTMSPSSPVIKVVFMKAAQIGVTQMALNCIGAMIDIDPAPILFAMSTDKVMKETVTARLDPMIENTPSLNGKMPKKSRDSTNTNTLKEFPGGLLYLIGANSPSNFSSKSCRMFIGDEIDRWPRNIGGEGDPIAAGETRTRAFGEKKKLFYLSTPTQQGDSIIYKEFLKTDQRKYKCPCPHCGTFITWEREFLKWDWGFPDTVVLVCKECGEDIQERRKTGMLKFGRWEATAPENSSETIRGYFLNALYSPYGHYSWKDIAAEVEKCMDEFGNTTDVEKKTALVNLCDGLPYQGEGESPPWADLYQRRGRERPGTVPDGVDFVTVGIDTQNDRLEAQPIGWGPDGQSYVIEHVKIPGDPAIPGTWDKLERYLETGWKDSQDRTWRSSMTCIDTGGGRTKNVYKWLRKYKNPRVRGIKGAGPTMKELFSAPTVKKRVGSKGKALGAGLVWMIASGMLKEDIYSRLTLPEGSANYVHFPDFEDEYFKGLTCEKMTTEMDKKGYPQKVWTKPSGARNEPLDLFVYGMVAGIMLGMDDWKDWKRGVKRKCVGPGGEIQRPAAPPKPSEKSGQSGRNKIAPKGFWGEKRDIWKD